MSLSFGLPSIQHRLTSPVTISRLM
jgi:hypothetical protein